MPSSFRVGYRHECCNIRLAGGQSGFRMQVQVSLCKTEKLQVCITLQIKDPMLQQQCNNVVILQQHYRFSLGLMRTSYYDMELFLFLFK